MIILLKLLTVFFVFVSFYLFSVIVFIIPWYTQKKWGKTYLLPLVLTSMVLFVGVVTWVNSYVIHTCSGMGCMGVVLVPLIIFGVSLGVLLLFSGISFSVKRFSLSKNFIYSFSLVVALILLVVLQVFFPANYSYDAKAEVVIKEYNIRSCQKIAYGLGMFVPRGSYLTERCDNEIALYLNSEKYCEKLEGEKNQNCKNNLKMIQALSQEKCHKEYDVSCVVGLCRKHVGSSGLISMYNCGYQMTKEEPAMCEVFGEQSQHMPHCQ